VAACCRAIRTPAGRPRCDARDQASCWRYRVVVQRPTRDVHGWRQGSRFFGPSVSPSGGPADSGPRRGPRGGPQHPRPPLTVRKVPARSISRRGRPRRRGLQCQGPSAGAMLPRLQSGPKADAGKTNTAGALRGGGLERSATAGGSTACGPNSRSISPWRSSPSGSVDTRRCPALACPRDDLPTGFRPSNAWRRDLLGPQRFRAPCLLGILIPTSEKTRGETPFAKAAVIKASRLVVRVRSLTVSVGGPRVARGRIRATQPRE